ncbi:hypothetical protein BDV38DRAFT_262509 [Aspergillus pseudotamarii]|uniref:Uncharacterized protein n=1 Tax=Aspergillus pseudotamarii TaxID=132259 RepID=A0A5N6SB93_ASPPS|nr:uncharacterized protein BDV38DRAFT_262509 [Aspergillus pseudotamarii]KAE8131988.1 hypothetical protein BDV38DRAFT_262509 [Aspergillus pseudotamarii]
MFRISSVLLILMMILDWSSTQSNILTSNREDQYLHAGLEWGFEGLYIYAQGAQLNRVSTCIQACCMLTFASLSRLYQKTTKIE